MTSLRPRGGISLSYLSPHIGLLRHFIKHLACAACAVYDRTVVAAPASAPVACARALRRGRLLVDALCTGVLLRLGQKEAETRDGASQREHLRRALPRGSQIAVQLGVISAVAVLANGALAAATERHGIHTHAGTPASPPPASPRPSPSPSRGCTGAPPPHPAMPVVLPRPVSFIPSV